ncbi:uncharacterized protein M6B38_138230 [Iris pallida]|uniref:Uncharacterized protein n=1 Tax=Iris pallida TaxID=29817 RepID=A0AAX6FEI5_IRIPA|nr:uncharacterized protein M6B38_138230 [Iris pallida]
MADAKESREARRRRLVARGGDRLAFITGQSRSFRNDDLPLPPPTPPSTAAEEVATPPKIQADDQTTSSATENYDRVETFLKEKNAEILPKNQTSAGFPNMEAENEISKHVPSNKSLEREADNNRNAEPSPTAVAHRSSLAVRGAAPPARAVATKTSLISFTPNEISSSISASEDIRMLCAIVAALLVVFSYHLGMGSFFSFRPLFLVLLTDATVVFGRLLINRGGVHLEEEARRTGQDGEGWDIGKMLEAVMVLQKASSAAFMDCSVCAVVMICGIVF